MITTTTHHPVAVVSASPKRHVSMHSPLFSLPHLHSSTIQQDTRETSSPPAMALQCLSINASDEVVRKHSIIFNWQPERPIKLDWESRMARINTATLLVNSVRLQRRGESILVGFIIVLSKAEVWIVNAAIWEKHKAGRGVGKPVRTGVAVITARKGVKERIY